MGAIFWASNVSADKRCTDAVAALEVEGAMVATGPSMGVADRISQVLVIGARGEGRGLVAGGERGAGAGFDGSARTICINMSNGRAAVDGRCLFTFLLGFNERAFEEFLSCLMPFELELAAAWGHSPHFFEETHEVVHSIAAASGTWYVHTTSSWDPKREAIELLKKLLVEFAKYVLVHICVMIRGQEWVRI
ncbi:hypothetical protein BS17DRAFT_766478 [Gyrodon lividus]|nr:hypothetical protein BS17DRAFT_766478 [Gyrodon lividus]